MARSVGVQVGSQPITHGVMMGESNTGLNYRGVSRASLTYMPGPQTFSTAGVTIQGKIFDSRIDITANNITIQDCLMYGGSLNEFGFLMANGISGTTFSGVDIRRDTDLSWYICLQVADGCTNTIITRCNLSGGKTQLTNYGDNTQVTYSYFHDTDLTSDPTNHPDNIEWYGGNNGLIQYCSLPMGPVKYDGSINISPYDSGISRSVLGLNIYDNFIDGGQGHILVDNQGTGQVTNVQVLRNLFGGHTNPDTVMSFGIYHTFTDEDARGTVTTVAQQTANPQALLWPLSGADANYWYGCGDLSPDNSGLVAPAQ